MDSKKLLKTHSRSKSVINPSATSRVKLREGPKQPRFGNDLALNHYIESALRDYKKQIREELRGQHFSTTLEARKPIDGVKMAKARNRLRLRRNTEVNSAADQQSLQATSKHENESQMKKSEEPPKKELSPEEDTKKNQLNKDLANLVPLPQHLFELDGVPMIKKDADMGLVDKYLKDLQRFQELKEQKEDSSEEIDEEEFKRLEQEFGLKQEKPDDIHAEVEQDNRYQSSLTYLHDLLEEHKKVTNDAQRQLSKITSV